MSWKKDKVAYDTVRVVAAADYITPAKAIVQDVTHIGKGHTFSLSHYQATQSGWNAHAIESDLRALGINFWSTNYNAFNDTYMITVDKTQAQRVADFFSRAGIVLDNVSFAGLPQDNGSLPALTDNTPVWRRLERDEQEAEFLRGINEYWANQDV